MTSRRRLWRFLLGTLAGSAVAVLALHGCYTPPVILEAGQPAFDLALFPSGTEHVELQVEPGVTLRGVFVPGPAGAPVVLHLMESMSSATQGALPMAVVSFQPGNLEVEEFANLMMLPSPLNDAAAANARSTHADYPAEPASRALHVGYQLAAKLPLLGLSFLVFDWEGVGASTGERSPDHLRRDARLAWDEALRRAGGDPRRILLRATSIGVLAAATLIEDGARPAAVTIIAPVRAETVALNFKRPSWGTAFTGLVGWFVRDAVDVDLVAQLARVDVPLLVVVPEEDLLLPVEEADLLRGAVETSGGVFLVRHRRHEDLAIAARDLLAVEVAFYERCVPGLVAPRQPAAIEAWAELGQKTESDSTRLRAVIDQAVLPAPRFAVALALSDASDRELAMLPDWLAWMPAERRSGELPLEAVQALVALDDPAGRLDPRFMADALTGVRTWKTLPAAELADWYGEIVREGAAGDAGFSISMRGHMTVNDPRGRCAREVEARRKHLLASGLSARDADRQVLRMLLKCAGIPERVTDDGGLEVWTEGAWRLLPFDP